MLEVYAFDMLTGQRLTPLPVDAASWAVTTNADETMSCTILADSIDARTLRVWEATTLARSGLLFVVDGAPVTAGPLWKRTYTQGAKIELTAGGLRSYWERRVLLPAAARATPLVNASGAPNVSLNTVYTASAGLSLGTIAKRYVQLAQAWPGAALPIVLPADSPGAREREVKAIDVKTIRTLLDNLSDVDGGPDIAFKPRWASNGLGVEWVMQVGTEARPRLGNTDSTLTKWTVGAPSGSTAFGLKASEDATSLTSEVWAVGGSSGDKVIAARGYLNALPAGGYPLLQSGLTGLSNVTRQATAQSYADQAARLGQYPASFVEVSVQARAVGAPILGDYWLGDLATITIDSEEPVLPAGDLVRRIAAIKGDAVDDFYTVTFAEAIA